MKRDRRDFQISMHVETKREIQENLDKFQITLPIECFADLFTAKSIIRNIKDKENAKIDSFKYKELFVEEEEDIFSGHIKGLYALNRILDVYSEVEDILIANKPFNSKKRKKKSFRVHAKYRFKDTVKFLKLSEVTPPLSGITVSMTNDEFSVIREMKWLTKYPKSFEQYEENMLKWHEFRKKELFNKK